MSDNTQRPDEIWLQWHGDQEPDDAAQIDDGDVSWCRDKIFQHDISYTRTDLHKAEVEKLKAAARLNKYTCEVCWTNSVAPVDPADPEFDTEKHWFFEVDGEKLVCQCCQQIEWLKQAKAERDLLEQRARVAAEKVYPDNDQDALNHREELTAIIIAALKGETK